MLAVIFGFGVIAAVVAGGMALVLGGASVLRIGPSGRLIVYGSLAPGEANHRVIAHMRGTWRPCSVRGVLSQHGGYNVFESRPDGPEISALLFESPDLPSGWAPLDAFEGDGYRRIVVPADTGGRQVLASIYADARVGHGLNDQRD